MHSARCCWKINHVENSSARFSVINCFVSANISLLLRANISHRARLLRKTIFFIQFFSAGVQCIVAMKKEFMQLNERQKVSQTKYCWNYCQRIYELPKIQKMNAALRMCVFCVPLLRIECKICFLWFVPQLIAVTWALRQSLSCIQICISAFKLL